MAWNLPFEIPFGGGVLDGVKIFLIYILPVLIVGIVMFIQYQNKRHYIYNIRMFKNRADGKWQEANFKGAFLRKKGLGAFFKIKTGSMPWQSIQMMKTPDTDWMDTNENRLYFLQRDIDNYIQLRKKISKEGIKFYPVDTDVKYSTALRIQRIRDVISIEPTWKKVLPYFGILGLAAIVLFAYVGVLRSCGA